jgi:hypothetical protein
VPDQELALREATRDDSAPRLRAGWGADLEAMWEWKDALPARVARWLGRYLQRKQTLLSPGLLACPYQFDGAAEDFLSVPDLSPTAGRMATHLLGEGPTSTRVLRSFASSARAADAAIIELGQALLVTLYGVDDMDPDGPAVF